jgi:hypothetical protein
LHGLYDLIMEVSKKCIIDVHVFLNIPIEFILLRNVFTLFSVPTLTFVIINMNMHLISMFCTLTKGPKFILGLLGLLGHV